MDLPGLGDRTTAARFANSYKVKTEIPVYLVALTFGVLLCAGLTSAQYPNATGGQVGAALLQQHQQRQQLLLSIYRTAVPRPQGWFLLVPPLTKPNPLTGTKHVDDSVPQERWSAMVLHGRQGHNYDFAANDGCVAWKNLIGPNLYQGADPTIALHYGDAEFADRWLAKSRCAKDDNRRAVITDTDWSGMMKRYFKRDR